MDLISGVKLVSRGGTFISKEIDHLLIEQMSQQTPKKIGEKIGKLLWLNEREKRRYCVVLLKG